MINIDTDIVSSITNALSGSIQALWPVIAVLLSIIIGFFVIRKLIFIIGLVKR